MNIIYTQLDKFKFLISTIVKPNYKNFKSYLFFVILIIQSLFFFLALSNNILNNELYKIKDENL